jgi:hypothetical protein
LQQHGHPRGQLIALDRVLATTPHNMYDAAELGRLRQQATRMLLGALDERRGLELAWRHGFIKTAKLLGGFDVGGAVDLLFDLLRHPSARFLRELVLDYGIESYRLAAELLLRTSSPPPLRRLWIGYRGTGGRAYQPVGEIGTVGSRYPLLEDVYVDAENTIDLHGLSLPRARRFALRTLNVRVHTIEAVIDGAWPALEELELWFGVQTPCTIRDLRLLLDGTVELPRLRTLRLRAVPFADDIVELLVQSPLARRLEVLDLQSGGLSDAGVDTLLRARDDLGQLKCELAGTKVTQAAVMRLRERGMVG